MDVLSGNPAVDLRARIAYRVWQGCIQKAAAHLRMNGLNRNNTSTSQSKGGTMLNYKWIRVLWAIFILGLAAVLILIFTQPAGGFRIPARLAGGCSARGRHTHVCHSRVRFPLPALRQTQNDRRVCARQFAEGFRILLPGLRQGTPVHAERRRAGITPHVLPEHESACPAKRGRRFHVRHTVTPQRPALHIPAPARGRNRGFPV